jgi:hypothetical protein
VLTAWTKSLLTGHRVEFGSDAGLSAAHDLALLPRDWKNSDTILLSAGDGEYRWKVHCKVPLRDGRGNNFHVKDLVDRFRANDPTHPVTDCGPVRALKFDSLWRDR